MSALAAATSPARQAVSSCTSGNSGLVYNAKASVTRRRLRAAHEGLEVVAVVEVVDAVERARAADVDDGPRARGIVGEQDRARVPHGLAATVGAQMEAAQGDAVV